MVSKITQEVQQKLTATYQTQFKEKEQFDFSDFEPIDEKSIEKGIAYKVRCKSTGEIRAIKSFNVD
jgi:hypothetical protein